MLNKMPMFQLNCGRVFVLKTCVKRIRMDMAVTESDDLDKRANSDQEDAAAVEMQASTKSLTFHSTKKMKNSFLTLISATIYKCVG